MAKTWIEKYEPKSTDDMILNPAVRNRLENVLREPQSTILYGTTGVGKGSFTKIFIEKTGCDYLWKNASNETGVDMIRNDIEPFAYAGSPGMIFKTKKLEKQEINANYKNMKVAVLNEAENLSDKAQACLRELIERVEKRCKFIFMTNDIDKIDRAIQSRCLSVEIKDPPYKEIAKYTEHILEKEGIIYEKDVLADFIQEGYPDIRKIINELQGHSDGEYLIHDNSYDLDHLIDRVFLNLRMHMAFYKIHKKDLYEQIDQNNDVSISYRQFNYLLRGENTNKVSSAKKQAMINYIQEQIPVKKWHYEYMKL